MTETNHRRVAIIDYELGNMFSVKKACDRIGLDAVITSDKHVLMNADAAILPGVGAFGNAMDNLHRLDLVEPIRDFIRSNKQFLGICLGLQLLFTESEEFGTHAGLNIIEGSVKKFARRDARIRVPHIGWNHVARHPSVTSERWEQAPLSHLGADDRMYFVHSFYVVPSDPDKALTSTMYEEIEFCSSVCWRNIFASQFHPEKSALDGIQVYEQWAAHITGAAE